MEKSILNRYPGQIEYQNSIECQNCRAMMVQPENPSVFYKTLTLLFALNLVFGSAELGVRKQNRAALGS